jgi:hypothetical protein
MQDLNDAVSVRFKDKKERKLSQKQILPVGIEKCVEQLKKNSWKG